MIRRFLRLAALVSAAVLTLFSCGKGSSSKTLSGEFYVSDTEKVRFTRGNLFWDGKTFGMEANQYDYRTWPAVGANNSCIGGQVVETPAFTTGLFYWSKTKSITYAKTYTDNDNDGSRSTADAFALTKTAEHDAAIKGYDVLTTTEWYYLLNRRANAPLKYGLATITGVGGDEGVCSLILLPDDWALPSGCSFTAGKGDGYSANSYPASDWQKMEKAGAVFLPASGYRHGATLHSVGSCGYYWSASPYAEAAFGAGGLYFDSGNVAAYAGRIFRDSGRAVRLVKRI